MRFTETINRKARFIFNSERIKEMHLKLLISLLVLIGLQSFSQDKIALRHTVTDSTTADFYIQLDDEKVKFNDTLIYFWFKSQKIHNSQGASSGNLLNGPYSCYYHSGQIKERGEFKDGLKNGEWKTWFESGQIKSVLNFEMGILSGEFKIYSEQGELISTGQYKSGRYHGDIISNGTSSTFKHGEQQEEKIKKDKEANETTNEEPKKFQFKKIFKLKKEGKEKEDSEKSEEDKNEKKAKKDKSDKPKTFKKKSDKPQTT